MRNCSVLVTCNETGKTVEAKNCLVEVETNIQHGDYIDYFDPIPQKYVTSVDTSLNIRVLQDDAGKLLVMEDSSEDIDNISMARSILKFFIG